MLFLSTVNVFKTFLDDAALTQTETFLWPFLKSIQCPNGMQKN